MRAAFSLIAIATLVTGCFGGGKNNDGSPGQTDGGSADQQALCSADYPCGPFGTQKETIIQNHAFQGFADSDDLCKKSQDKALDTSKLTDLSFGQWFKAPTKCPAQQKKLLWIMVSAGWCGPCKDEITSIQKQYAVGGLDPQVEVLNVLFEDDRRKPATEAFGKTWASSLGMTFPLALDPKFTMGKYFDRNAVPINMLIDLRTMKIFYKQTGANLPAVGRQMVDFLDRLKRQP